MAKPENSIRTQLEDVVRHMDQMPVLDSRTPDEILGYDDRGLPNPTSRLD